MQHTIALSDGWIDLTTREVHRPVPSRLTRTEADLLRYLVAHAGEICTWKTLLFEVWGYNERSRTRTTTATAHRLRAKIEADAAAPKHLHTIWGTGLRFTPEAVEPPVDLELARLQRENAWLRERIASLEGAATSGQRLAVAR